MSGVQLKTIADYQAAIQKLDRNKPADRAKIAEYSQKIGELLQGQGKVDTQRGELNIYEGQHFKYNNDIADGDKIAQLNEFNKNAMVNGKKQGSKAAHQNVKDKFGSDYDEVAYKAKKEELKAEEKKLKEFQKEDNKTRRNNFKTKAEFDTTKDAIKTKLDNQREVVAKLKNEMLDLETAKTGASKKFAKKYEKAARKNVEQYEKTQSVVKAFTNKSEAKAWEKQHPGQKAAILNENDLNILADLHYEGTKAIKEADKDLEVAKQSGNETAIKEAEQNARKIHDKYDDYVNIYAKDENGKVLDDQINVDRVQNILVDKSGGDQNFNLDEVKVMAADLDVKKGQIKHLAKTFGFGTESQTGAKLKAAGIAAGSALAGEVIGGLFKTKHSHQKAEAVSEAQGETKVLETLDVASSGEVFYHYLEAQGGEAFAHAVAEACAKYVPGIGLAAAPVLAGLSAFLLTKGATEDVFGGANVEKVLDNIQVAEKNAQPVLKEIKDMQITGDPERDKAIKAAVLKAAQGEDSKAMNLRELQSALADLEKTKDVIGKLPVDKPEEPKPPVEPPKPTVTEQTVWDIDGNGFIDGSGNTVTINGHEAQGATGHARDWEKLAQRGAPTNKNDINAKAQFVIADEKGETKVVADMTADGKEDLDAPAMVTFSDNTNPGQINTYEYVKISDADLKKGYVTYNGQTVKLTGLDGKDGPFYLNLSVHDKNSKDISSKTLQVYQLELQKETKVVEEKDEQGNITKTTIVRPKYHMEQYKGMNGSRQTNAQWNKIKK